MATYYIATTGNDTTGNGSSGNPWATISKAFTSSADGDTIVCAAGTYTWVSQNFSTGRTVQGATLSNGLPTTIFDGGSGNIDWRWSGTMVFTNIMFQNLINTSSKASVFYTNNSVSNKTATFTNCVFKTIKFYSNFVTGGFNATSNTYAFVNCLFWNVYNTSGIGNYQGVFMDATGSGTITLTGCVMYFGSGYWTNDSLSTIVMVNQSTWSLTIKNTIIQNASGTTMKWSGGTGTYTQSVTYCCLNSLTSGPSGTGNITSDPLFVDAAGGNFRLRPTSPCLNTGSAV